VGTGKKRKERFLYYVWEQKEDGLHFVDVTMAVSDKQALNNVRFSDYGNVSVNELRWPLVASTNIVTPPFFIPVVKKPTPVKHRRRTGKDKTQLQFVFAPFEPRPIV